MRFNLPYLIIMKMEDVALNMKETWNFIKTYYTIYTLDPSDVEAKDHLARGTQPEGVDWLKPYEVF